MEIVIRFESQKRYDDYLQQHSDAPKEDKYSASPTNGLKGENKNTARTRQQEFPLRKPNKQYSISVDDCIVRVELIILLKIGYGSTSY